MHSETPLSHPSSGPSATPGWSKEGPVGGKDDRKGEDIADPNSKACYPWKCHPWQEQILHQEAHFSLSSPGPSATPVNTEETWVENHPQL